MSKRAKMEEQEDLECPICTKHLMPPVYQCHEGHLLCEGCVEKTQNICPTCRGQLPPQKIRNRAIEKIIRSRLHPCMNSDDGCKERLEFDDYEEHTIDCFYSYLPFCDWLQIGHCSTRVFMMKNLMEHCEREHGIIWSGERSLGEEFKMVDKIPENRAKSKARWGAFSLRRPSGIPLFVMVKVVHKKNHTSWLPFIVGRPETAGLYDCKITLTGKVKMSWKGDWLSLLNNKEDRQSCFTVSAECLGGINMEERQNNSYEITVRISARDTASN